MKLGARGFALITLLTVGGALPAQLALEAYMHNLNMAGKVMLDRGRVAQPGLDANTAFDLKLQVHWNSEISIVKVGRGFDIIIAPVVDRLEMEVRHQMVLPKSERMDSAPYRALLLHEYDHVAVSTDERPQILLRSLIRDIGIIRKPWTGPIPPPMDSVNNLVRAEVEARKTAVVKLMEHGYEKLDEISDHGRRSIENRMSFFPALYSGDHLKSAKFPYLKEVEKTLTSAEFQIAKRYYRN